MLNFRGKAVDCLRVITGKSSGWISPIVHSLHTNIHTLRVQPSLFHELSDLFTPILSPYKFAILPLIEHTFYPVSTAPTNNPTKRN